MTHNREAILRVFRVGYNRAAALEAMPAMSPGWDAPVVRRAADDERELATMGWGFVLLQPGKARRRVTNTRDDKMMARFWNPSIEQRRCIVPATSFCEPNDGRAKGGRATWHSFALKGDEPRPRFAFAGIWQRWKSPIKKEGEPVEIDTHSFMTTEPNSATASINLERSLVLLATDEQSDAWLDGTTPEAMALVRPIDGAMLRIVGIGAEKQDISAL